jgi:hypothetical protein
MISQDRTPLVAHRLCGASRQPRKAGAAERPALTHRSGRADRKTFAREGMSGSRLTKGNRPRILSADHGSTGLAPAPPTSDLVGSTFFRGFIHPACGQKSGLSAVGIAAFFSGSSGDGLRRSFPANRRGGADRCSVPTTVRAPLVTGIPLSRHVVPQPSMPQRPRRWCCRR